MVDNNEVLRDLHREALGRVERLEDEVAALTRALLDCQRELDKANTLIGALTAPTGEVGADA